LVLPMRGRYGGKVPLSEDEQRILNEIEQKLKESDPHLAREVSSYTVYRHALRNIKWALVGFVAGLVVMIVTLSTSFLLAFVGFLLMLGSALMFERNARRLGRAGLNSLGRRNARPWRGIFGDPGRRLRERLGRRDGDEH
jgi:hypothetical protein